MIIFYQNFIRVISHAPRERVSWNVQSIRLIWGNLRHAPRERVSWNPNMSHNLTFGQLSRSTWACELKYKNSSSIRPLDWSRSTWACELKYQCCDLVNDYMRHAPRERVSWNANIIVNVCRFQSHAPRERVSWNCFYQIFPLRGNCHAPRERVSWNADWLKYENFIKVTLHVSVWVEIDR